MKTISIEIPDGKRAEWVDGVLTLVDEQPKDITERIKTFEDAKEWCLANGQDKLVKEFDAYLLSDITIEISPDILAYFKLRIITCALNEGWEPTFEEGEEKRYSPIFDREGMYATAVFGMSLINGTMPYLLYFKSTKLASYAATQFKDIYLDFCKGKE